MPDEPTTIVATRGRSVYYQSMHFKKMPLEAAVKLLAQFKGHFEFVTMTVSNKPFRQWSKEQGVPRGAYDVK